MAEREGFEPSVGVNLHTLSKRAPSTARPPLPLKINRSIFVEQCYSMWLKKTKIRLLPLRRGESNLRYSIQPVVQVIAPPARSGEGGIRTHGTLLSTIDFESIAFDQLSHLSSQPHQLQKNRPVSGGRNKKVRPRGFEPLTYGSANRCSIQLSYGRIQFVMALL